MLYLVILVFAAIGCLIAIDLIQTQNSIHAKLLGTYTLAIAITSTEPIEAFIPIGIKPLFGAAIAVFSFIIGPALFLYCKHRLSDQAWRAHEYLHFVPAVIIMTLYFITYFWGESVTESDSGEFILYLLFALQLLSYSFAALIVTMKNERGKNFILHQKLQAAFLKPLVVVSIVLFTYSFIHSLIPVFKGTFVVTIQVMIAILIIVIAFLNSEKLEKHLKVK